MAKPGAPRKYKTAKSLRDAVEDYFDSITQEAAMEEVYDTGKKDKKGHEIYAKRPVLNKKGEPVKYLKYLFPPEVGDLCVHLRIHRDTWNEYCNHEKHPKFSDTTTYARGRMYAWNQRQLLTREGKDVRGIIFNLQANYGCSTKSEVEIGERAAKAMSAANMSMAEKEAILLEIGAIYGGNAEGGDADDEDDPEE